VNISFNELTEKLEARLKYLLPGPLAHEEMRAVPVGSIKPNFDHQSPPKAGSVLILLYPEQEKIFFPLIQRSEYEGAHSGQISLPGGKAEAGEEPIATALREGEEEIGVPASQVNIIGKLSDFFVIPSNFLVTPVVGFLDHKPVFKADPVEVEKIIFGNLHDILRKDAIKTKEILAAGRYRVEAPHFEVEDQLVWGATAMMLNELRMIVRECYPIVY